MLIQKTTQVRQDFTAEADGLTFTATLYEGTLQVAIASATTPGAQITIPGELLAPFVEFCQTLLTEADWTES